MITDELEIRLHSALPQARQLMNADSKEETDSWMDVTYPPHLNPHVVDQEDRGMAKSQGKDETFKFRKQSSTPHGTSMMNVD
ncbi:hypothetical protein QFC21_006279, partial [Naganishia friedmannii]